MTSVDGAPSGIPGPESFPTTLEPYLGAVMLETFFYGLYTVLFSICTYVLLRRRRKIHWILPFFAVAMYTLATADMGYTLWLLFGKLLKLDLSYQALRWKYWLYVTNNVLADTLLLYRCYVVWDYDKRVIVGPSLLLVGATVCGFVFEGSVSTTLFLNSWIYIVLTFVLNVVLTVLTASRIWWLSYRARKLLDPRLLQQYNVTLSILIESGVLYSLYMVLDLAFHTNPSGSIILDAGLIQIVGIMPTLIIAQIGVGRAVHDTEASLRMTNIESVPMSTNSKIEIQSPTTESTLSVPYAGAISVRIDTRKHRYDASLSTTDTSIKKEEPSYPYAISEPPSISKETLSMRETHYQQNQHPHNRRNLGYHHHSYPLEAHCGAVISDIPCDVEKGEYDPYVDADLANGSVLDYVLREENGREEVVPWEANRTPIPPPLAERKVVVPWEANGVNRTPIPPRWSERKVVPWEANGDNRTPMPSRRSGSMRLKKPRPGQRNSRE